MPQFQRGGGDQRNMKRDKLGEKEEQRGGGQGGGGLVYSEIFGVRKIRQFKKDKNQIKIILREH